MNASICSNVMLDLETMGDGPDAAIVAIGACTRNGTSAPWAWRNDRCYRTIKALNRGVPMERLGAHHNALDDAISQALHLIAMLNPKETG